MADNNYGHNKYKYKERKRFYRVLSATSIRDIEKKVQDIIENNDIYDVLGNVSISAPNEYGSVTYYQAITFCNKY